MPNFQQLTHHLRTIYNVMIKMLEVAKGLAQSSWKTEKLRKFYKHCA